MTISESLRLYGPTFTALMVFRKLASSIDDDGQLVLERDDADDISLVACELDDVLWCAE